MARIYWFCGHEQFQPEELVRNAVLAEKAGFDGVMVSEHFHPWVDDQSGSGFAFSTLGAMAQATQTLELMTAVTAPLFRFHPAVVAQAAATIDRLSQGRFTLGVGTGRAHDEEPLGYHYPSYAELSTRMQEALEIMRRLLDGEKLTYRGTYYRTETAKLYSPPVHRVPIYLAAGGSQSAGLAAKYADGIITSVKETSKTLTDVVEPAQQAANGTSLTVAASLWTVYAQNENDAWEALAAWRGLRAPNSDHVQDPTILRETADKLGKSEILKNYKVVNNLDELVDAYTPLISELGADIVGIQCTSTDVPKLIEDLGKKVVPALKRVKEARE